MKKVIILILCLFINTHFVAQSDSKNGYQFPAKDTLRICLIFAEATGDANYDHEISSWPKGEMPLQADNWFDSNTDNGIQAFMTKYFYQASHG